jgi:hypothetical protein
VRNVRESLQRDSIVAFLLTFLRIAKFFIGLLFSLIRKIQENIPVCANFLSSVHLYIILCAAGILLLIKEVGTLRQVLLKNKEHCS